MVDTQHPSEDDLKLYLLDRLPGRKSVRIAEHLLLCPSCVEVSAELEDWMYCVRRELTRWQPSNQTECTAPVLVRPLPPVTFRASKPSRHAGYGMAAALALTISLGMLLQRPSGSTPATVVSSGAVPAFRTPAAERPLVDPVMPGRTVRKPKTATRKPEPYLYITKYFVAPPTRTRTDEPEYLSPPAEPVSSAESVSLAGMALPTDIGQLPDWPATPARRNLLLRFLAVIAKPFRSDGM